MRRLLALFGMALAWTVIPAGAQRRPVLPQIDEPHPYYYRELYLPQLTSGPSSLSWSPDSRELVYSMGGSLWRQKLDSKEALQLTDGPGYDYQPDWSPDAKSVVYVSYQKDAMELWLLDVASGKTQTIDGGRGGQCGAAMVAGRKKGGLGFNELQQAISHFCGRYDRWRA